MLSLPPNYCISHPRRPCSPRSLRKCWVSTSFRVKASLPDNTNGAKVEYTPWLIVGLGNPGNKYHGTRHNMIDGIAKTEGIEMNTIQPKALIGIGGSSVASEIHWELRTSKPTFYRDSVRQRHQIDAALDQGVEAVSTLVLNGFDQTITSFNLRQIYKYHKV